MHGEWGWRWHETGIIWISLSNAEIPDRPLGDFRASAVRALEGRSYSGFGEKCVSTELREANPIFQGPFATRFS